VPSTVIVVDHCRSRSRLLHFQCKKTLRPIPRLFQRSKVVSINLPILPFLKFKICVDATGHGWDLCVSERWEGWNFLLLIETIWRMAPGLVPTFRQRARDPTLRKFLPKLKITEKDIDLALYRDLCRSLSITISRDRFNVKKTSRPITWHFQRPKVVSRESGEEDWSATGLLLRTNSAGPVSQTCYDL
jgi:hypothetical protein